MRNQTTWDLSVTPHFIFRRTLKRTVKTTDLFHSNVEYPIN